MKKNTIYFVVFALLMSVVPASAGCGYLDGNLLCSSKESALQYLMGNNPPDYRTVAIPVGKVTPITILYQFEKIGKKSDSEIIDLLIESNSETRFEQKNGIWYRLSIKN